MQDHIIFDAQAKLLQLDWEVLIRLPYSPDVVPLMPTDFGLYRILLMEKISVPWKTINTLETVVPRGETAELYGSSTFNFLRKLI